MFSPAFDLLPISWGLNSHSEDIFVLKLFPNFFPHPSATWPHPGDMYHSNLQWTENLTVSKLYLQLLQAMPYELWVSGWVAISHNHNQIRTISWSLWPAFGENRAAKLFVDVSYMSKGKPGHRNQIIISQIIFVHVLDLWAAKQICSVLIVMELCTWSYGSWIPSEWNEQTKSPEMTTHFTEIIFGPYHTAIILLLFLFLAPPIFASLTQ